MKNRHVSGSDKPEDDLIDHFQSQKISNDKLYELIEQSHSSRNHRIIGMAVAASIFLLSMFTLVHQNIMLSLRSDIVLREAALNHSTKLRMDSEAVSVADLQNELAELPFDIKLPESEFYQQLALVGGRYCTISGNLAAHLKLAHPETDEQFSLFLTPYAGNMKNVGKPEDVISGVDVKLWREHDVIYAFAKVADNI